MKVSSTAGDLDVSIKDNARIVGDTVLLNAEMGVWQFQIYLSPGDFRFFFSLIFSSTVLLFLIKQPFLYIFRQIKK
ncbi:MAG: hypothetical protein E4H21_10350 [Thermodesulfobacteriales bacterium]|nr:MAG: hypothetical protein E4H21_10350 [Thermodesulfobacteriales bacterium]